MYGLLEQIVTTKKTPILNQKFSTTFTTMLRPGFFQFQIKTMAITN